MIWIRWANILRIKQRFLLVFWCLDYCTSNSASQDTVAPRPDLWIWWTFGIFSLLWSRILQTSLTPTRHKFFVQDSLGEETACSLLPGDFRGNNWSSGAKYQISIDIQHFQFFQLCRLHDVPMFHDVIISVRSWDGIQNVLPSMQTSLRQPGEFYRNTRILSNLSVDSLMWKLPGLLFMHKDSRLGGTSLKAAALLSALRAQLPEAETVRVSELWSWLKNCGDFKILNINGVNELIWTNQLNKWI